MAPLKLLSAGGLPLRLELFHGTIAVAPLKPTRRARLLARHRPLPRHHRRGPIEASRLSSRLIAMPPLPRHHRRGPIEAARCGRHRPAAPGPLPRHHRRGPIEANDAGKPWRSITTLPRLIAVAPLKPNRDGRQVDRLRALFHGFIAVAPLKRTSRLRLPWMVASSSTASSPWPH